MLRIVDAGNFATANPAGATIATNGDVSANIYVFNDIQEQQECCSCLLTANSLMTFSVITNLISNPFNPKESLEAGVIKIVGSAIELDNITAATGLSVTGSCSNSPTATTAAWPYVIAGGLHAWLNHTETMASNQAGFTPPFGFITSTSVDEFTPAGLDSGENLPTFRKDAQPSTTPTYSEARPLESASAVSVTEPKILSHLS